MTAVERGYLLLCCHLGNPHRKPLTTAQFRKLANRVRIAPRRMEPRNLEPRDLEALGYSREEAVRIVQLLEEDALLDRYLAKAKKYGCVPLSKLNPGYPDALWQCLGDDAPACLWARGNVELLKSPRLALVGSRELEPANALFAREAGTQAARQGFTLVSGNARGADRTAQDACIAAGGNVISILADRLTDHVPLDHTLYLSEEGFDLDFSPQRALSRNRCIHILGQWTLAAQCSLRTGGTWDGCVKNLRFGWSPLYVYDDGSESVRQLELMGAGTIDMQHLSNLKKLPPPLLKLI